MEGVISEIRIWAANFAPQNWMFCQGQLLPIAQYTALFSLLGTNYGGNGTSNFALPDLRGRVPVGAGQAPGLSNRNLGQTGGNEAVTLNITNLPAHNHLVKVNNQFSGADHPAGKYFGASANDKGFYNEFTDKSTMAPDMLTPVGGNMPFDNMQPYLGLNYIICVQGFFPQRA
jgi:microcystin-dependent protein